MPRFLSFFIFCEINGSEFGDTHNNNIGYKQVIGIKLWNFLTHLIFRGSLCWWWVEQFSALIFRFQVYNREHYVAEVDRRNFGLVGLNICVDDASISYYNSCWFCSKNWSVNFVAGVELSSCATSWGKTADVDSQPTEDVFNVNLLDHE